MPYGLVRLAIIHSCSAIDLKDSTTYADDAVCEWTQVAVLEFLERLER